VHFDETTKQELVADIRNYLDPRTRKFYTSRGIPYRRGFLFYGTPGTGKTSLSLALAGTFGLELYLVHLPSIRDDTDLTKKFTCLPPRCIVLLEDIDAVGAKRQPLLGFKKDGDPTETEGKDDDDDDDLDEDSKSDRHSTRCTLSGLLNVLDGVASQEGRIVLMTSNFAEKLDEALVRPGRIDRKIYLGPINQRSAELMFLRMYSPDPTLDLDMDFGMADGELEKLALKFSNHIVNDTFTPAQLQGYLLNYRDFPRKAAEEIEEWVKDEMKRLAEQKERQKKIKAWRKQKRREKLLKALAGDDDKEKDST
jgi:chaperone BCS1